VEVQILLQRGTQHYALSIPKSDGVDPLDWTAIVQVGHGFRSPIFWDPVSIISRRRSDRVENGLTARAGLREEMAGASPAILPSDLYCC